VASNVSVSVNVPALTVASVMLSVPDVSPAVSPEKAAKPLLLKPVAPATVKLPASWSASPVALFCTSGVTATVPLFCCNVPRLITLAVDVPVMVWPLSALMVAVA
jgi:hypothetical protein